MNLKSITGFLDALANLKEIVTALRSKDTELERQASELRTQNLLLAQELTHIKDRLTKVEGKLDQSLELIPGISARTPRLPRPAPSKESNTR